MITDKLEKSIEENAQKAIDALPKDDFLIAHTRVNVIDAIGDYIAALINGNDAQRARGYAFQEAINSGGLLDELK